MTSTSGGEGLSGHVSSQAHEAASAVEEKAVELKHEGGHKLGEAIDRRTTEAGEQVREVAHALRETGQKLRSEGKPTQAVDLVEAGADRLERLGGYLGRMNGDGIMRDVEDFARRRPWMVAGIGLIGGLVSARFLKASSERRYDSSAWRSPPTEWRYESTPSSDRSGTEPVRREPIHAGG
jgi:hypothetical protein